MKGKSDIPFRRNLSFRQARNSVLVAFLVGIVLSGFQIAFDYNRENDALDQFVGEIISASKFAAADAAFHLDAQAAQQVAKGLMEYASINNVVIKTETGVELANLTRNSAEAQVANEKLKFFGSLQKTTVPLYSAENNVIGEFVLVVDPTVAGSDFVNRSALVIAFGIIRNILLAFLLTLLFHYTITKQLVAITRFLSAVDINKPKHRHFNLSKRKHRDEFSELAESINDMLEVISRDIDEREAREKMLRESDARLSYQASHDDLTGLLNRREFDARLHNALQEAQVEKNEHVLCYLDLDQFKVINDTCGHIAGDELLRQLGSVLQHGIRKHDTLARLGGDEFGILMEHCDIEHATAVADNLCKQVEEYRFMWENQSYSVGVSIGVVSVNQFSTNAVDLFQAADVACYAAKDAGRNRVHVYTEDDAIAMQHHGEMQWTVRINKAIEEDRFKLYAQTIAPLASSNPGYHCEVLLRMVDEDGKIIPPGSFLPAAERYDMMSKLDRMVVEKVFNFLQHQKDRAEALTTCSINLSGQSLTEHNFLEYVTALFDSYDIPPEKICFEITETAAIANLATASKFIQTMKDQGCYFALDDFGSGLSSFAYLKNLPVDFLKIDGMFVRDIVDDPIDFAMVKSINEIAQILNKETIAEFVENDLIMKKLHEIGVDYVQGYAISYPEPLEDIVFADSSHRYPDMAEGKSIKSV